MKIFEEFLYAAQLFEMILMQVECCDGGVLF